MSDASEAVRVQRQVVQWSERLYGRSHPETGKAQGVLCDFLLSGRAEAAEAQRYCLVAEHTLGAAPPAYRRALLQARLRLAQAYMALGSAPAADSMLTQV